MRRIRKKCSTLFCFGEKQKKRSSTGEKNTASLTIYIERERDREREGGRREGER